MTSKSNPTVARYASIKPNRLYFGILIGGVFTFVFLVALAAVALVFFVAERIE